MTIVVHFVILLCIAGSFADKTRYDGYQLVQIQTRDINEHQSATIQQLTTDLELDVWSERRDELDLLIPPHRLTGVKHTLAHDGLVFSTKNSNIQRDIDDEDRRLLKKSQLADQERVLDYNDFNTYDDILSELDELVVRCPTGLTCETVVHGVTHAGRDIKGIRIYRTDRTQKKVWIDATIHAREWLATATGLKIISHMVDGYSSDTTLQSLVDKYDWYLLPILNPDGYAYTWSDDRLWRKNRKPNDGSICVGTDLNRNFDHMWGNVGASTSPCSITFQGPAPGSEAEVIALQTALYTMSDDLLLSVNLHTYGRMWLIPWGYQNTDGTCYVGPDHDEQMVVANAAADAVEETHNTVWTRGPFCTVLYPGSGTSIDYGKGVAGVKHTFLPELRGNNFVISKDEIQPSFEETWNGIVAAITAIDGA